MKEKLGLGVIGIGFAGRQHLGASKRLEGIIPIGICDTVGDGRHLKSLEEEYSLKIATADYDELLECEDIDIISVAEIDSRTASQTACSFEAECVVITCNV